MKIELNFDCPEDWLDCDLLYVMLVKRGEDGKLEDAMKCRVEVKTDCELKDKV